MTELFGAIRSDYHGKMDWRQYWNEVSIERNVVQPEEHRPMGVWQSFPKQRVSVEKLSKRILIGFRLLRRSHWRRRLGSFWDDGRDVHRFLRLEHLRRFVGRTFVARRVCFVDEKWRNSVGFVQGVEQSGLINKHWNPNDHEEAEQSLDDSRPPPQLEEFHSFGIAVLKKITH